MTVTKRRYPLYVAGAILFALGLALLASVAADLRRVNESLKENTHTQLRLMRDILYDEFNSVVGSFDAAAFQLSGQIEDNNAKGIHQQLDLLKTALPAVANVLARNRSGEVIGESIADQDLINTQAYFTPNPTLSNNNRLVSFEKSFNKKQQLVLVINYQIKDPQGELTGLIQGRLDTAYLQRKLASLRLGKHMYNGLAFEDGTVLLLEPEQKKPRELTLPYSFSGTGGLADNGIFQDHLFASEPLSKSGEMNQKIPLYLVTWADTRAMTAAWKEQTIKLFLGYLVFSAIVLLIVRARITQQFERFLAMEQTVADQHLNDERFKLATESAGIGVWEYNLEDKTIRWDKAMRKIYGAHEEQEMIAYTAWLDYIDPQDVNKLGTVLKEAPNTQEAFEFSFSIRRASDRKIRNIQARAKTHRNTEGIAFRIIGINVDITVQHQFEDALREAEERFRSSFEWASIGMAILNFKGKFLQVNKALADILGYSETELLRFSYDAITHPQDLMRHTDMVRDVLKGRRHNYQLEKRYIHKEGHVVWVFLSVSAVRNDKGRVLYFISQIQDITERKRNEAKMIERERFLHNLSECLSGLVSYWDTDLRCQFANSNHEKWHGIVADKIRGQHMRTILGDELFDHDQHHVLNALRGTKQRFERKKQLPSGEHADMLVHLVPDVLEGKVQGFFSISTNITDFKAQQRELERINGILTERTEQAEAASKAKGAFVANMSHEIRTPMNAIMGLLQLLEDTELQAKQRDYLSKIGSAADVLLNVLNDILDISRIEANRLELDNSRFELHQVLRKAIDLFAYRAEEIGIQLHCTKDGNCPVSLRGDRLRLAQILNNLLSNALKFTDQGHIHLRVHSFNNGKQLQFSVQDTGIGMSQEQCAELFKPFSQVDDSSSRRYGGAGLGLSICKNLVELMGGEIWVDSKPGKGSTFHFTVDCTEPEFTIQPEDTQALKLQQESESTPQGPAAPPLLNQHVLVVDDHKLNRVVASEMLKKWGAKVSLAVNGVEAVQACLSQRFDCVLMDLQMPEMDGFEATRIIRQNMGDAAPPIVALTASASAQDRIDILNAGMCEHVIKPFKKETLIKTLLNIQARQPAQPAQ